MVDFFEQYTSVRLVLGPAFAIYHSDQPGALAGGRSIRAEPFDLRELGDLARGPAHQLSLPFYENAFGGMMIDFGAELRHFYNVARSPVRAVCCDAPRRLPAGPVGSWPRHATDHRQ